MPAEAGQNYEVNVCGAYTFLSRAQKHIEWFERNSSDKYHDEVKIWIDLLGEAKGQMDKKYGPRQTT